jgi:hypothetical protein
VDPYEDPVDVYRIRVPARASVRVRVRPAFGDPDLYVFSTAAATVVRSRGLVASSRRSGRRTDAVVLANPGGRARTRFVAVGLDRRARSLDAGYALAIRRGS